MSVTMNTYECQISSAIFNIALIITEKKAIEYIIFLKFLYIS